MSEELLPRASPPLPRNSQPLAMSIFMADRSKDVRRDVNRDYCSPRYTATQFSIFQYSRSGHSATSIKETRRNSTLSMRPSDSIRMIIDSLIRCQTDMGCQHAALLRILKYYCNERNYLMVNGARPLAGLLPIASLMGRSTRRMYCHYVLIVLSFSLRERTGV